MILTVGGLLSLTARAAAEFGEVPAQGPHVDSLGAAGAGRRRR
ncbi:hypothetical protein ACFVYP_33130 [Kitasatospora sp. NPDC058201]